MKKHIILLVSILIQTVSFAQADSTFTLLNLPKLPALQKEFVLGMNSSFARGEYVDYVKDFSDIQTGQNTSIRLKILPKLSPIIGVQYRYLLPDSLLKGKLSVSIGAIILTRGMVSKQKTTVNGEALDTRDNHEFKDHLRATYLSIPIKIRYGQKYFGEIGLSYDRFLFATRQLKSKRSITGSDAYEGGFSNTERSIHLIKSELFTPANWSFLVGVGSQISSKAALAINTQLNQRTFSTGKDLKNTNIQLTITFKL